MNYDDAKSKALFTALLLIITLILIRLNFEKYGGWFTLSIITSLAYISLLMNKSTPHNKLAWLYLPLTMIIATTLTWSIGLSSGFICMSNIPVTLFYYCTLAILIFFSINLDSVLIKAFKDYSKLFKPSKR